MSDKKCRGSIFMSLVAFTAFIIVFNCFVMLFINIFYTNTYYVNDLKKYMKEQNQNIIDNYDNIGKKYDIKYEMYDMHLEQYDTEKNEIVFSSTRGRINTPMSYKLSAEEMNDIFDGILGKNQYVILTSDDENYETLISLTKSDGDQIIMLSKKGTNKYFILEIPAPAIINASSMVRNYILFTSIISMLFVIPVIILFSYMFTRPIMKMHKITNQIRQLNFSEKCKVGSKNELGMLAESINDMSDKMQQYISEINEKNIILEKDIELKNRLEDSQKKFISDVSHEFKTPVSIISGYAEGIKMGMAEEKSDIDEYCDIIISECERMTAITKQLLHLSKLESDTFGLNISSFDIASMIMEDVNRFSIKCAKDNIKITTDIPFQNAFVDADCNEIEKVLMNYISNAIKYCEAPGLIKVCMIDEGDMYKISVYNNGAQIKETEKIWNRFFREDKARTRNESSTGLGLSIVKATMELHRMPYGFQNKQDGVEFFIKLKKHKNNK